MTKLFTLAGAALIALTAGTASAADFNNDIGGDVKVNAVAIGTKQVLIGKDIKGRQASVCVKGTRVGGDFKANAVVIGGTQVAIGKGITASQGSIEFGKGC